jgi:hypothetical protein
MSVLLTLVATGAVTVLSLQLRAHRDTDRADPTAGITSSFREGGEGGAPALRFRDVAAELGVTMRHGPGPRGRTLVEDTGSGIAWGDVDGDGDWDLYVVNFPGSLGTKPTPEASNRLFRNDGDRFTDVTLLAGVGDVEGVGMGATFADYDGDGDVDLHVTNFGPNRLFRNRGDGTFEDVAEAAGVADPSWSTGAAWGDFDRDGDLDLYLCNYVNYDAGALGDEFVMASGGSSWSIPFTLNPNSFDPEPNRLFRNRGDGTFEDVAELAGVSDPEGRSLGAVLCDLDGDGWLDLYVNNDVSTNKLFRNMGGDLGDGTALFTDLSAITGSADPRGSMGLSIAEIGFMDGGEDGLPDLFITHWIAQENAFYRSVKLPGGGFEYRDKTRRFRLGEVSTDTVGWGCGLVDLDRDGRPDLVVSNGSTMERKDDSRELMPEPFFVFWNDGERFQEVAATTSETLAGKHHARGLAAADFDGDGDVDLAVAINRGQPLLLRNETETPNRSLVVRLDGPAFACQGARLILQCGERRQTRWWGGDISFLGMHAPEIVFGLGEADLVDRLDVLWADGKETTLLELEAGFISVPHPSRE